MPPIITPPSARSRSHASKIPNLKGAQRFVALRDQVPVAAPLVGWPCDPEIEAINHALTIAQGHDFVALTKRVHHVLRAAFAMDPQLSLGFNAHAPLVKITLPIIVGAASPSQLNVSVEIVQSVVRGEYYFFGPRVLYSVNQFELYRPTIEAMFQGHVAIDRMFGAPGGVCIYRKSG